MTSDVPSRRLDDAFYDAALTVAACITRGTSAPSTAVSEQCTRHRVDFVDTTAAAASASATASHTCE